jgi:hypothetical protein
MWHQESAGGGEQFDEVAGRVGEQDLASAGASDDVAAEGQSGAAQALDLGIEIVNDEVDAVTAGCCGVRRCGAGAGAGRPGQQQPQRTTCDVGERTDDRGPETQRSGRPERALGATLKSSVTDLTRDIGSSDKPLPGPTTSQPKPVLPAEP